MAENKKSFVLYSDMLNQIEKLTNEEAGELFKMVLRYVNDLNPTTDNRIVDLSFEPIKTSLKRDLDKWERQIKQRSEAGKKSAEMRKKKTEEYNVVNNSTLGSQRNSTTVETRSTNNNDRTRNPTDSVSVSVNGSVSVNDILLKKETKDICVNGFFYDLESAFELFWDNYQLKKDRANSFKKFEKIKKEDLEEVVNKAKIYGDSFLGNPNGRDFQKLPSTWLNGKNWEDEIIQPVQTKPKYNPLIAL